MAKQNKSLNNAKTAKNDEFYTLMEDIENELSKYDFNLFKDKILYKMGQENGDKGSSFY